MAARKNRVNAAAAQRESMLEKDLNICEASFDQIMCEHRDTACPGASLATGRPWAIPAQRLLEHQLSHTARIS
jgi:hypothetical protein